MKKIVLFIRLILRSKFFFKTPQNCELIIFDETSFKDLKICLSKINTFVLQTRFESTNKIYFSYKIFKQIFKNFFKGNLFTVYLISLIELIKPKVVITNIDNSIKFSDVAKVLDKKINFIAIQNASRIDLLEYSYLYNVKKLKNNVLEKFYLPNFFCFGDYEIDLYKKLNIKTRNIYPVGSLRWANFIYKNKENTNFEKKYNSDICLVPETFAAPNDKTIKEHMIASRLYTDGVIENGFAKIIKYTVKFCIRNKMKLILLCKRDKKYSPAGYKTEIDFFKRNLNDEEFQYVEKNILEKDTDDFSSFKAVFNSKVTVGICSTLLKDKLATGGKILSCNFTKKDMYDFPVNGICKLNDCSYEEFEKRLREIYSISKESFFSKLDKKSDYVMKLSNNYSVIEQIRKKLSHFGINQNF